MWNLCTRLYHDQAGFIVSAELVLVSTVVGLGLVVGLSEVSSGINQELEDVASAFGSINQSYRYCGASGHHGSADGSRFQDSADHCDDDCDIQCDAPSGEGWKR